MRSWVIWRLLFGFPDCSAFCESQVVVLHSQRKLGLTTTLRPGCAGIHLFVLAWKDHASLLQLGFR